ncbi:hypothetical protein AAG906_026746 [Vitis piasezkii]
MSGPIVQKFNMLLLDPLSFSLFPFFFFIVLLVRWLFSTPPTTHKTLPPSPPRLPVLGNMHQLGIYPYRSLLCLARCYGPLMLLQLGRVRTLVVSSPDAAQEIMKTHDLIFANRPKMSLGKRLLYDYKDVSVAPYGEYWRQMRSICVLHLLSNKRVQSFNTVRREEISLLIQKIEEFSSLSTSMDLSGMFMRLTNDVICRVAFGRKYSGDERGKKFRRLLGEFVELLGGFNVGDYIPWLAWVEHVNGWSAKVERVAKEFDEFLDGVVEEHLDGGTGSIAKGDNEKDFVDVLLEIQRDGTLGFSMDRDSIKALILDIFAGGTDTTYTVLEWAMTELLRHPKAMKELQNEVRGITRGKEHITEDDLEKMHYLKAVIKETLRLHPPIPLLVPRESSQDVNIMGYHIPAGTMVIINAWAIGRDPMSWDEPEEFRPESWKEGCPGISFAMATNELVLANLVNKFDWALPDGARVEDLDMTECTGLTIHRKFPLLAVSTPCF